MTCRSPHLRIFFATVLAGVGYAIAQPARGPVAAPAEPPAPHPLVWEAMEQSVNIKKGETAVELEYRVKNQSGGPVTITELRPSCGCTTADAPAMPWTLGPGANGSFRATVDLQGKHGKFSKVIHVMSSAGVQMLSFVVNIPDDPDASRRQSNQAAALGNRQAVFQGTCAACHVVPTVGQKGEALFQTACGICHSASPRAAMVPDLLIAKEPRDAAYWRRWISEGREASLMPAFAHDKGGPLSAEQVESLVAFALQRLPTQPAKP